MTSAALLSFLPHINSVSAKCNCSGPKQFLRSSSSIPIFEFSQNNRIWISRFGAKASPAPGGRHRHSSSSKLLSTLSSSEPDVAESGQNLPSRSPTREHDDDSLPTMDDIVATAALQGLKLEVSSFGPTFRILLSKLEGEEPFGCADGWVLPWIRGKILHLESVSLVRGASKEVDNIFGAGFFVGAATLRYGLDEGCKTAELLAIYDDKETHAKLVKYYRRLGFKTMYKVNEEDWKYFVDRVVWGGIGTRMDADCEELLRKWSRVLKPRAEAK